jgi:hypothetical protein
MSQATREWITLAVQAVCLATLGWILIDPPAAQVTLAQGMAGYGHPACPTEDATAPAGCVWRGSEATWLVYPGRT